MDFMNDIDEGDRFNLLSIKEGRFDSDDGFGFGFGFAISIMISSEESLENPSFSIIFSNLFPFVRYR